MFSAHYISKMGHCLQEGCGSTFFVHIRSKQEMDEEENTDGFGRASGIQLRPRGDHEPAHY
ncbi:MAG: hypothetical protein CL930_08645 [Deltaproteobacteria bacterium]|nr:hypothetical protein [Deltaproteobacteria bacterium]